MKFKPFFSWVDTDNNHNYSVSYTNNNWCLWKDDKIISEHSSWNSALRAGKQAVEHDIKLAK